MPSEVRLEEPIFALYTGLTVSGYDLSQAAEGSAAADIIHAIASHTWPKDAVSYFEKARVEAPGINPYWPRAAMLLNATFHLRGDGQGYANEPEIMESIALFPTDDTNKGPDTMSWIREYPNAYRLIEQAPTFASLWKTYASSLGTDYLKPFEKAADDAVAYLCSGLGARETDIPDFVVVPNPLQAPQIADFVRKKGVLYAVIAVPRASSITHELLHSVFEECLHREREAIAERRNLFAPEAVAAMRRMQYAWDAGEESWLRVFEESLVRAASIWIGHRDDLEAATRAAESETRTGFIHVPAMLRTFRQRWIGLSDMKAFVASCLHDLSGSH